MRRGASLAALAALTALVAGCGTFAAPELPVLPRWVPLVGGPRPVSLPPNATPAAPPQTPAAPLVTAGPRLPADAPDVLDRIVCVVNNDAVTQSELDESERFYLYETRAPAPPEGEAREALRKRLLERMIESRLQLQQAEREKMTIEDAEIEEQLGDVMRRVGATNETAFAEMLKANGLTLDTVKKRIRDQLMVQKIIRRRVSLRVSVTEQDIDRYLEQNRAKLETGLTFEAHHILVLPDGDGEDAWQRAHRVLEEVHARVLAGEDFEALARRISQDGSGREGGALGTLKRGELAPEIEAAILALRPGEVSAPFRSSVGWHLFRLDSRQTLAGDALVQARNQIRDILVREKHEARLKEWLTEIRQRAVIDMRL